MMDVAGSQWETSEIFLHHTQRNQILLRRQLGLLEAMERRETDAEELADLFRVDHLTTRIRRNVEKLISLAGGNPGRRWLRPVPLLDVVRAAVAEVEDYPRVLMSPTWTGAVAGSTLPDLIHVLAELIENGLSFSPPSTTVRVSGELWDGGVAIVINDDGPGLGSPELAAANQLLRDPPEPSATSGGGGLSVVGQLARRRGVTVELRRSPRGGTTAVVLIPATLVLDAGDAGVTDDGFEQTAEYPQVSAGAGAGTPVSPSALHATPAGLPVRRRRVDVDAPPPPPAHNLGTPPPDLGAPPGAASHNRTENGRAWGPVTGGSATVEFAVTRAAPDEPAATPPASDHRP
jgi:anti-sigma regulatory factor (Ser/Thr protein kinase)